jgi:hypothetical protein
MQRRTLATVDGTPEATLISPSKSESRIVTNAAATSTTLE